MLMPSDWTISRFETAGADHHAEARARNHEVAACRAPRKAHRGDREPVDGYCMRSLQLDRCRRATSGTRHAVHVVVDRDAAQLLEDEDESVSHQHLLQVIALVEIARRTATRAT